MLPLSLDTLRVAGRAGSVSGTEIRCVPGPAAWGAAGATAASIRIKAATSGFMTFSFLCGRLFRAATVCSGTLAVDRDVAVDRAEGQLGPAAGDPRSKLSMATIMMRVGVARGAVRRRRRQGVVGVVEVGVDLAVQGLEPQIGG